MEHTYPALLFEDIDNPGFIVITFPDLIGVGSECLKGEEMETAKEVLELVLSSNTPYKDIPPSKIERLKEKYPDQEVILVTVNI